MQKIWLLLILTIFLGYSHNAIAQSEEPEDFLPIPAVSEEETSEAAKLTYRFWKHIPLPPLDDRFMITNARKSGSSNLETRLIALLDGMTRLKCTGTLLTTQWIVTAAHCLKGDPDYAQSPYLDKTTRVNYVYKHANFAYEMASQGEDVALLQNDIGLVLAAEEFPITDLPSIESYTRDLAAVDMDLIIGAELVAYGFGRHAARAFTRPLFVAQLRGVTCRRNAWTPCFCAASIIAGACAGDSGGPVYFRGIQVGITSLGPAKCIKYPGASHTVFTNLKPYAAFLHKTLSIPIDSMLKTGGPNPNWLTPVYFTPHASTSPWTLRTLPSTTKEGIRIRDYDDDDSSGSGMGLGFKLYFFVFVFFLWYNNCFCVNFCFGIKV